jgi:hypothetical protein
MSSRMLPRHALAERWIALSASESPDLDRLGLRDKHVRFALGEIARAALAAGGRLAYGGHLRPDGYTAFLVQELERQQQHENLIQLCIAWPVHRAMSGTELDTVNRELPLAARIIYLDLDGKQIDNPMSERGEHPEPVTPDETARGLTAMRQFMTHHSHARVLIGGKRSGFTGRLPGLMEEALLALEAGLPLYLAAGFGGATLDIARALGLHGDWPPPADDENTSEQLLEGRRRLAETAARPGWRMPANGLNHDENRLLASTHRPGEIAALVSLGVGRLAEDER